MATVQSRRPHVDLHFLASKHKEGFASENELSASLDVEILNPPAATVNPSAGQDWSKYGRIERSLRFRWNRLREKWRFWTWKYRQALRIQPDVVQASDARDLPFAVILGLLTGCTVLFDSLEDYFNQVYEYRGQTWSALFGAIWLTAKEIALARFCDHVFVTSLQHQERYRHWIFGIDKAHLLPNYAPKHLSLPTPMYNETAELHLVYVGTVNPYRGVRETAEFCGRFNEAHPDRELVFHYIGFSHHIVDDLVEEELIEDEGAYLYPDMMKKIAEYDVGVCLLHDIEKFHNCVPVKNFDYMAAGLPVLTGDFGEMKRYVEQADAGFCIDPVSYAEFEDAILKLFDPNVRQELGQNGRTFTNGPGSFEDQAKPYVEAIDDAFRKASR